VVRGAIRSDNSIVADVSLIAETFVNVFDTIILKAINWDSLRNKAG